MMIVVGTIAIVLVTLAIGLYLDRKVGLLPRPEDFGERPRKPPEAHGAGEAPATAIRARTSHLDKLRAAQLCAACRRTMTAGADDTVRYNDHDLVVLHFACPTCTAKRSLYVAPFSSEPQ